MPSRLQVVGNFSYDSGGNYFEFDLWIYNGWQNSLKYIFLEMAGNDDDDDEIILDHRAMNPTSPSDSILVGLNQFNIGMSDQGKKLSKEKWIILVITCISIVGNLIRYSFE
jgi:hypothetical protein